MRALEYDNAKLQLEGLENDKIDDQSDVTYSQFLEAIRLLQLTTLPYEDRLS